MSDTRQFARFCAIRRTDPIATDALLAAAAARAKAAGLKLAGVLQREVHRPGRRRCDMDLIDLASDIVVRISEDRGNLAQGCRVDTGALAEAAELVERGVRVGAPDLVILNKFGKAEEEGRGMRDAICAALLADIPVLLSVGELALPAFELFAGDLCTVIEADAAVLSEWLRAQFGAEITLETAPPVAR
jgi:nucleoside-triphosphatase THEP1